MKKELLTVCVLTIAAASFAAMPAGRFKRMDADKDGKVTLAEFQANITSDFNKSDKNKDGFQDATEASEKTMSRNDADKDGKLSLAEVLAVQTNAFKKSWDKNKDGVLSDLDK